MYRDTIWFREEIEMKRVKFLTNCEAGLYSPAPRSVHLLAVPLTFPMVYPI